MPPLRLIFLLALLVSPQACRTGAPDAGGGSWLTETLGRSREGRPIEAWIAGAGPDRTLILATIHGNESAGTPLLRELRTRLDELVDLSGRQVVLVPVANPDGFRRRSRFNASGVDLNRNYPAANFRATRRHGPHGLSEPESRALHELLQRRPPDRVVSIHQPLARIDHDGPAGPLAQAMARHGDLPVKRIGSRPGSLGSYVGLTLKRPIITLELPAGAQHLSPETLWARYGPMLLQAIVHPDLLPVAPAGQAGL